MSSVLDKPLPWLIDDILSILPHRFPFLLVDRVISMTGGESETNRTGRQIVCIKNVTMNEPFFPGHFPKRPIMPGVLIVEALAQAAALLAARPVPPGSDRYDFLIASTDQARFRKPVIPGDRLELIATIKRERSTMFVFETEARVDGEVVAQAEIMAKMFAVNDP